MCFLAIYLCFEALRLMLKIACCSSSHFSLQGFNKASSCCYIIRCMWHETCSSNVAQRLHCATARWGLKCTQDTITIGFNEFCVKWCELHMHELGELRGFHLNSCIQYVLSEGSHSCDWVSGVQVNTTPITYLTSYLMLAWHGVYFLFLVGEVSPVAITPAGMTVSHAEPRSARSCVNDSKAAHSQRKGKTTRKLDCCHRPRGW